MRDIGRRSRGPGRRIAAPNRRLCLPSSTLSTRRVAPSSLECSAGGRFEAANGACLTRRNSYLDPRQRLAILSHTMCSRHLRVLDQEHLVVATETRLPADRRALPVEQPCLRIANMAEFDPIV